MHEFFFGVYPYLCLTILGLGLLFRYLTTPGEWNARSSNLFAKKIACHRFIYLSLCNNTDFFRTFFRAFDSGLGHGRIGSFLQGASGSGRNIRQNSRAMCLCRTFYSSFAAPGCKGCMGQHCSNGSGCAVVHHVPVPYGRVPGLYGTFGRA